MKLILVGYPGSQFIVPASKYLVSKYAQEFEVTYLNYEGPKEDWSDYIREYLETLSDELIIFALDDYLLSSPLKTDLYQQSLDQLKNPDITCVKLCPNTLEEHAEYPVTTQYTIWKREYLMFILGGTTTPWDFEINGSRLFEKVGFKSLNIPALDYPTASALSARWSGVKLGNFSIEDLKYIIENKLL